MTGTAALTMAGRSLRISRRSPDALIAALMLPVMLMLIFVYFFGGAIDTGTAYVTYVVPGAMLLCAGFGAASTAVSVADDMKNGIVDRLRSLDVGGVPVLAGHVTASVVRNLVSTTLVLAVALAIGFRPRASAPAYLAAAGLLVAYITAISWLAATLGLLAKSPEAAGGFTFLMMFLPYPSSAFVPIDTMPSWLHGFAGHQPLTPVIESLRALLLDRPAGNAPWTALAWCAAITALAVTLAGVLFRRRTR
ncbi:Daunorubicin/doxorubicin resistance ABC transporter permease protein DrrB [Streptomyces lavendulae subsp. lavendulae]|uniref:Transport permease protein n=1 Tax=Streptomyces lavendulae subsp. lavendulae TaxID=58340 RepID=A0A2K8PHC5_STRLA|nr:ABC transporter permease [Streptomyces lavendulae]ATZ26127.1 Daunorubicin/doxorubicin resistance ABC transporter permease protein DrrB [Streptomyces lavendulae subsp. lavendulae]QUQ55956.1 Daunorubicin/doxorubicin resistance ABC transporter permease protein DrrB [Streptomyces lavendulae subsp. lavendulae]GLW02169.1 transport permease protein [Streptomyces lavendulae subsp. lavendulae]